MFSNIIFKIMFYKLFQYYIKLINEYIIIKYYNFSILIVINNIIILEYLVNFNKNI